MNIARRTLLLTSGAGAGLWLSGCGTAKPTVLTVRAQAQNGMNPGPDGKDRPVTLNILQLAGTGAFNSADAIALQNPSAALGSDLIKSQSMVLAPGGTASAVITVQPGTSTIGVVGGFRNPSGRTVRTTVAVPSSSQGLIINVGPGGLSLAKA